MGGLKDFNDLVYLQIKGKNQLFKEIDECHTLEEKIYDPMALHRNEMTGEIEDSGVMPPKMILKKAPKQKPSKKFSTVSGISSFGGISKMNSGQEIAPVPTFDKNKKIHELI